MARSSTTYLRGEDHPHFGDDRFDSDRPPCRQRLRDRRTELGLSQEKAAGLLGCDRASWRRYENGCLTAAQIAQGRNDPGLAAMDACKLLEVACLLGVSPFWLVFGVERDDINDLAGPEVRALLKIPEVEKEK